MPRITLVRHGRSAHVHRDGWVDADGVRRWRTAYEAAGIAPDDVPPPSLVAEAAASGAILSSNAARAIASAERLAPGRQIVVSALLRERELPPPQWLSMRAPLGFWALAIGLDWGMQVMRGTAAPPAELERARDAVDLLSELAQKHESVIAVCHVAIRGLLASRLLQLGWRAEPNRRRSAHWSAWAFVHTGDR